MVLGGGSFGGGGAGRDGSSNSGNSIRVVVRAPSGGGGGSSVPRAVPIADESQQAQIKAEAARQAALRQAEAQAQALAAAQAKQEALNKQQLQQIQLNQQKQISDAQDRDLAYRNLQARLKYQESIRSGTSREDARAQLDSELGTNRLNYFVERAKRGIPYENKNVIIKQGSSGQVEVIDKKTNQILNPPNAQVSESSNNLLSSGNTDISGLYLSNIKLPYQTRGTKSSSISSNLYTTSTASPGINDFIGFGEIPILAKIKSNLITPSSTMVEPGATTREGKITEEKLKTAQLIGETPTIIRREPGFPSYAIAGLIPTTPAQIGMTVLGFELGGLAMKTAPYLTSTGFTIFGIKSAKGYANAPTREEKASSAAGTLGLLGATKFSELSFFGEKPYQVIPTPEMEAAVQPFSRQRATLMLQDNSGNYIFGKTKTGEIISIGGGIEKGQTPRQAVIAELGQETGLGSKDISGLKFIKTIVTPEETFQIFTAKLKPGKSISASSDIKSIISISPKNIFVRGVTGQTSSQPISRYIPFTGRLRAYEAGIMNFLETGKQPTWLALNTPRGQYYLGTQSRYNVPFSSQKQYMNDEEILFAHGTPNPAILKRTLLPGQKEFTIEGEKTARGQAQGLYIQPPTSPGKGESGYIGLSYLGFQTSQESSGIKIGFPTRTAFLFSEKAQGAIQPTPKTFSGMESEYIITPETKVTTAGKAKVASVGLKRVYMQPTKVSQPSNNVIDNILDISSEVGYKYITPGEVISPLSSSSSVKELSAKNYPSISKNVLNSESKTSSGFSESNILSISPSLKSNSNIIEQPSKSIISSIPEPNPEPSISEGFTINSRIPYSKTNSYPEPSNSLVPKSPVPIYSSKRSGSSSIKSSLLGRVKQAFKIITYKRGKEQVIGKGLPEGRARKLGAETVLRTLRASFKLVPEGFTSQEDIDYRLAPNVFSPSKRDALRFVQRRNLRLSARPEVSEIQIFKRASKSRGKKFKWF